jgi:hypothetical protein
MNRVKPERILGIKVGGVVTEASKNWFEFEIRPKNRDKRDITSLKSRIQKVENGNYKYFREAIKGTSLHLIYLTEESLKGLYKNKEDNLPYEILGFGGSLIYRQSIKDNKEDIYNRLEQVAVEDGLRKKD